MYEVIFNNIKQISLENRNRNVFSMTFDYILMEANVCKLVRNREASSMTRLNSQLVDIVLKNVINEINQYLSTFIKMLNEHDRILIIDGIVSENSTNFSKSKSLISVRPDKNSSIILLKLSNLSLEKSNLLQNKNLSKITGPGIYLLFGDIKVIIKYTDEEFMLLRIQSYDKCCIKVHKYPYHIRNFNNIFVHEITSNVKFDQNSYRVDILVKKPCLDFLSLILNQQIILYNVKVIHSKESGIFSLYVNGKSSNLKAHKIDSQFKQIPTTQYYPSETSHVDNTSYSPSSPEYLKSKTDQTVNNINKRGNCSSHNDNTKRMNNNKVQKEDIYQTNKIIKPDPDNQVQQYNNRSLTRVSSLRVGETKSTNATNRPIDILDVNPINSDNSLNTLDSSNVNNQEYLGVNTLRCIGPCRAVCIEPCLTDEFSAMDLVSGYCTNCQSFTPMTYLTPSMFYENKEHKCLKCTNVLFLTFFFKLTFMYGEKLATSIELQCYKDKADDLIKQITKEDINVEKYLSNDNSRQSVVDAMRGLVFNKNNLMVVFYDLPSDNVHVLVSISTTIDIKVETI